MRFEFLGKKVFLYTVAGATMGVIYALIALATEILTDDKAVHLFIPMAPIIFGLGALVVGINEERNRRETRLLDEARERFSLLAHAAISEKSWEVSFEDPDIPTCWQIKNCPEVECPCHGKLHTRCWLVAGTFCRGEIQGRFAQKLGSCAECEIYQTAVERNPINEIGENFNNLMWALRENEDLLSLSNTKLREQYQDLQELQEKTRELAESDPLTGLKNHGHFQQQLIMELQEMQAFENPLSLIMVDLDYFKRINDEFGHQTGDDVLKEFGRILQMEAGKNDNFYSARYGGEEFVVVMPGVNGREACVFAEKLRRKVKTVNKKVGLPSGFIGASFGVADYPVCAPDAGSLISAADTALLFSKRQGRDRVAYFRNLDDAELREGDVDWLQDRLEGSSLITIRALAEAVDASDHYSLVDTAQLVNIARKIADRLRLNEEQQNALELATRLHDIGKIGVPGSVLHKSGELTDGDLEQIRKHPEFGRRLVSEVEQVHELMSAILYHHERWDGGGYPEQLKGTQIPLLARVVGILDAYRAMRSDRPYRKAMTVEETVAELKKGAGSQFDPQLVEVFIEFVSAEENRNAA